MLAAGPIGCDKQKKGGTKAPGGTRAEDTARAIEEAKQDAKTSALILLANQDLVNGRYVSATRRAEEALAENAQNADAHAVLGAARWRAGDFVGSTEAYKKALEIDETHFDASLKLGRNLQAVGDHVQAIALQDAVLATDPTQIDPLVTKLVSQYALLEAKGAVETTDKLFEHIASNDPQLPFVQALAAYVRPLADKGDLHVVTGEAGSMDVGINHDYNIKYTSAVVKDEFARVIVQETREETLIDAELASKLGLKPVGEFVPFGGADKTNIVIIPSVAFGELTLGNVPAIVQSLAPYEEALGETPGLVLGHQALRAFGAYTFDFPGNAFTVSKAVSEPPEGAAVVPFLLINRFIPAVPVHIDGSAHEFFVYFGGNERSGIAVTRKEYLKSGHLPRELEPLDDPDAGLRMVYVDEVELGGKKVGGTGGLVLTHVPPDPNLDVFLKTTAFELGGYINTRLLEEWSITYVLGSGKVYVKI